jgi:uncharacterized protein involved in exopolysaccharide biosynthesis
MRDRTIVDAARRYWPVVVVSVLVGGLIAAAAIVVRDPVYKADTRLAVGVTTVTSQNFPGTIDASQSLAAGYARVIDSPPVQRYVYKRLGGSPDTHGDSVSASPIPDTTLVRLEAYSDSPERAARLANLSSAGLVEYAARISSESASTTDELDRYREAAKNLASETIRRDEARDRFEASGATAARDAYVAAVADAETARLTLRQAETAFQEAGVQQGLDRPVQLITEATGAAGDSSAFAQKALFAGLVGGAILGLGLAALRDVRLHRPEPRAVTS